MLVVITSTVATFIMPESYASAARLLVRQETSDKGGPQPSPAGPSSSYDPYFVQTQFEVLRSEVVLAKVVEALDLDAAWGKRYNGGERLRTEDTLSLLKRRLDLYPVRNTSVLEVRAYSERPDEAAMLANAVVASYRGWSREHKIVVEVLEHAVPGISPVRPNKPLNITLGIIVGMCLAALVGGGAAAVVALLRRRSGATPSTATAAPPPLQAPSRGGQPG
jgi:capsular polysaccharide biosynthesis protein